MRFCEWNFQNAFFGALEFRMTGHPGHKCEFTHHQAAKQHFTISCSFFALIKMQWTKLVRKSGNFICLVQITVWFLYKINKKHFILISEIAVVTKMALCKELKTSIVLKLTLLKLIFFHTVQLNEHILFSIQNLKIIPPQIGNLVYANYKVCHKK